MSWYLVNTVTVIDRQVAGEDDYGNDVHADVQTVVDGCAWNPRTSSENLEAQQQVVSGMMLFCDDPDVPIYPTSAVIIDGTTYEVDGEVGRFTGSRMGNDHAEIPLRLVTG